jgi:hypothetical protein
MKENTKGNAQTDEPKPIDKQEILKLVGSHISKLKAQENKIMNKDIFEDDLLLTEEDEGRLDHVCSIAHLTTATAIIELKSLYKKIEAL